MSGPFSFERTFLILNKPVFVSLVDEEMVLPAYLNVESIWNHYNGIQVSLGKFVCNNLLCSGNYHFCSVLNVLKPVELASNSIGNRSQGVFLVRFHFGSPVCPKLAIGHKKTTTE